jgi:hypothetical protein
VSVELIEWMEMSGFRPELHVAQQSRRDKLRVAQPSTSTPSHHLQDFPDILEQLPVHHPRLNPDLVQVRNVDNGNLLYDDPAAVYSSEMLHFSTKSSHHAQAHPISSNFNSLSKPPHGSEPRNSTQSCDNWVVSTYASGSVGSETNIPSSVYFGEYPQYSKPSNYNEFQDRRQQKHSRDAHFTSSPTLYQNSLQDVVRGTSRHAWAEGGNELALLPAYGNQSDVLYFDNANAGAWSGHDQLGFAARKNSEISDEELRNVVTDSNPQGLSLSLSSNPTSKLPVADQFGEDSKITKSAYLCSSVPKPSIISRGCGKSLQDMVGGISSNTYRNTGPLGPFTGYATILKSSKFLRPAQQLLVEFCGMSGGSKLKTCEVSERMSGEVSTSGDDAMNATTTETEVGAMGNNNSGGSSSTFYSSNEISGDGGVGSSSSESFRPDYQQKKAKLLYMQEEVGC